VQPQLAAPEVLGTEGVEPECPLALFEHALGVVLNLVVEVMMRGFRGCGTPAFLGRLLPRHYRDGENCNDTDTHCRLLAAKHDSPPFVGR